MNSNQAIELSVRAAMLMKESSQLIGTHSKPLAKLILLGIKEKLSDVEKFLDKVEEAK
jgi:hypothetical protein